jgi:hypothetical protein
VRDVVEGVAGARHPSALPRLRALAGGGRAVVEVVDVGLGERAGEVVVHGVLDEVGVVI